jgi:hypothetical protein
MRAKPDLDTPATPVQERSVPRPQRRAAAVVAQYIQDLVQAQSPGPRPCSEMV